MRTLMIAAVLGLAAMPLYAGVQFDTVSQSAPQLSSTASSLVSVPRTGGADLYYMVRDADELYVSPDNGVTWNYPDPFGLGYGFPNGPSIFFFGANGNWWDNLMAYYPGLGAQGALILIHQDPDPDPYGTNQNRLVWFDIATQQWNWLGGTPGTITVISHGTVVIGNYLYGIWHAGGGNFGGPVARVNLASPGTIDERTVLSGISGNDSGWLSRAAQLTTVGGQIYGIKNDWATPQPATVAGDRLFRFDPASFNVATFAGGNPWDSANWSAAATPVTDLGMLPYEPGHGACLVPLPANWSSEIGAQGGLFIIFGQSPSNNEGWGTASSLYAQYDIATGTYTTGSLPGPTGNGTSATFHNGKVFIKRGGVPSDPYNYDLWTAAGTVSDPCDTPVALTVQSSPISSVAIEVVPSDCGGQANGATPFARSFGSGQYVSLTAPAVPGYAFVEWEVDGFFATDQPEVSVEMYGPRTAEAVYASRCDLPVSLSITSTPVDGVTITYTPADCSSGTQGTTPFSANYGFGETVQFLASYVPGYRFVRWTVDGVDDSESPSLTLEIGAQSAIQAVYEAAPPPYVDGCLEFVTVDAPVDSEFASAMASDGTYVYYLRRNSHQLFRSTDGFAWTELRRITDDLGGYHGDWNSGVMAYYPGAGVQGSLISRHRDPSDNNDRIARYDIAENKWYWTSTFTPGDHGATIVGNYRYAIWHAGGGNFGGPITRVDLTNPSAIIDERTVISASISGNDPHWYSRVANLTTVGGMIYGIKNDWYTNPAGTGDRLYLINPADWVSSTWSGSGPADFWNSTTWSQQATFATDLAALPFECGYGAAIVGLPSGWSCDVGNKGGLFIIAGRSPANQEGWGDASDLYAVYDIATNAFRTGHLPGLTGSGTSATLHDGKVFIKRGGQPDSPYNSDLWVVTPAATCNTPAQDVDGDGDVDLSDFAKFLSCFNGPNRAWPGPPVDQAACACLDQDDDNDVDLADFATFLSCFNGPARPPAAGCP